MKTISQANRAIFKLKSMSMTLHLSVDMQCGLFDKLITPVLLYGCEVWGLTCIKMIELFHRKFLKQSLKVGRQTANWMVCGELGRNRLEITMQKRLLNYWLHLKCDSRRKLAPVTYNLMRKLSEVTDFKSQWIDDVKTVLNCIGFSNCWDESDINKTWFLKAIDRRLKDIDLQDWNAEISNNRLCTFYRTIKYYHQKRALPH